MFLSPLRSLLLRATRPAVIAYKPPPAASRALHLPRFSSSPSPTPLTPYLAQLRSAFARPPATATATRSFSSSPPAAGPRPYYRGGSSSGGGYGSRGGAGPAGWRYKIDRLSPNTILYSIIGLNIAVFLMWQYGQSVLQQYRDSSYLRFMTNNFTCSWRNFQSGRIWTLLTCCFSHEGTGHILMNLASLYFMAPPVIMMLGNTGFLALYLFSGVVSSAISLAFSRFSTPQNPWYQSHGASGAVYGTIAFFAAAYPRTTFLIFFVVPVPAWLCVSGILAWDLYGSFFRRGGTTDSAGHVGGVAAGLLFFLRKIGRV